MAPKKNNAGDAWAYDEDAVKALGTKFVDGPPQNGHQDSDGRIHADSYPAGVFVTPDEKILKGTIVSIPGPAMFINKLLKIMKNNPDYIKPTKEEEEIESRANSNQKDVKAQLDDARLAWELADWERCLKRIETGLAITELENTTKAEFYYLDGRVRTCKGEYEKAMTSIEECSKLIKEDHELADDIKTAKARILLNQKKYLKAGILFEDVIKSYPKGNRIGEALYFAGLCSYLSGSKTEAQKFWKRHIEEFPHDRMARRSAISLPGASSFKNQELVDREGWW